MADNRSDAAPLLLGRFRVEATLGTGGFGQVVKAYDTRNKRYVAIKTLKRSLAAADPAQFSRLEERFMREVEANASVGVHRNIVTVFDQAHDPDNTLYLILEYFPRGTLADHLAHGPLPLAEALRISADVARGVSVAHRHNIVHRDVKPANIFLSDEGHAKIGDFGIAQLGTLSGRTAVGSAHPHTPLYASPEQEHSTAYLPAATDQYSLGLVLFEMLTAERYKQLAPWQRAAAVRAQPAPISALLERMTALAVEDRYPSMNAVVSAIAAIERVLDRLAEEGVRGEGEGDPAPILTEGETERNPVRSAASTAPLGAAIPHQPPPRRVSRRAMLAGIGGAVLVGGATGGALAIWRGGVAGAATATPTTGIVPSVLNGHTAPVVSLAFTADGQMLASAAYHENVILWRVRDGAIVRPLAVGMVNSMALSPDGQTVAVGASDSSLRLWRVSDGAPLPVPFEGHRYSVYAVAFSADGTMLASVSREPGVIVFRVSDGAVLQTFAENTDLIAATIAFSPDGQTVAFASGNNVKLGRVRDRTIIHTFEGHKKAVSGVAFSPNSDMIASASSDQTARLWRVDDGAFVRALAGPNGHMDEVNAVAFSPGGDMLASASNDKSVKVWHVSDGALMRTFAGPGGHADVVNAVAFSPAGQMLASGSNDRTIRLWPVG